MFHALSSRRLAVVLALVACAAAEAAPPRYLVTDLGTLGGPESSAAGINDAGTIVGFSNRNHVGPFRAFTYSAGQMSDLGGLTKFGATIAAAVNASGVAVGTSGGANRNGGAVVFANGEVFNLSALRPDWLSSSATAINDAGHVVGNALSSKDFMGHAFIYTGTGRPKMMTPPGSSANGINGLDQVVGAVFSMATLFDHERSIELGTLGGTFSEAAGINDDGTVTGWSTIPGDSETHAFVWRQGAMTDLGTLGGLQSRGDAIDRRGDVVGWSYTSGLDGKHAMLVRGGRMLDLNDLMDPASGAGWTLIEAFALDGAGHIVGQGKHDGRFHAFELTPM